MNQRNSQDLRREYSYSNQARKSVYIAAYSTMLVAFLWGLYFFAPNWAKSIFSLGMWGSVMLIPWGLFKKNDFDKIANWLLWGLLLLAIIQILRSVVNEDADMYALGNKWITLFGNEYTALLLMPPLFSCIGTLSRSGMIVKKATYVFLLVSLICILTLTKSVAFIFIYVTVFYPYVDKKYRLLILYALAILLIGGTLGENTSRMFFILLGFSVASCLLTYIIKSSKVRKFFVVSVALLPFMIFIPLLQAVNGEKTIFQEAQEYITENSDNEEFGNDTRTFLYLEMAEDLTNTNSWLMGKGAFSHYYSYFFDNSTIGKFGRISSEVPFLNYLLRGGIIYCLLYFGLILFAVYKAIWYGKNKFVQSIGIIAVGWYFNSFVGDITGCKFYHVAFFILIGICLSKKWLNYTDEEIRTLLADRNTK